MTKHFRFLIGVLLFLFIPLSSLLYGQISDLFEKRVHKIYSKSLPYRLFIPDNYSPQEAYPLVLVLHGIGKRGTNNVSQLDWPGATVWAEDRVQSSNPCIVVVPQCPSNLYWWSQLDIIDHLLYTLMQEFSIDSTRLNVFGVSMGGYGVWDLIQTSVYHFAAAIPIAAGAYNEVWPVVSYVPRIWNFHGTQDTSEPVSYSRSTILALEKHLGVTAVYPDLKAGIPTGLMDEELDSLLKAGAPLIYTESALDHNDIAAKAYADPRVRDWLLAQKTAYSFPDKPALPTTAQSFSVSLVGSDPVLGPGSTGSWDDWRIEFPSVIKEGDTLKMWYIGAQANYSRPQIGYAWSLDGENWHKYPGNPVMSADLIWENFLIQNMTVIKDDNIYRMWYSAGSDIGHAWSEDGITWTKHPDPVLLPGNEGEWDYFDVAVGSVIKEDKLFRMWYSGGYWFTGIRIGMATSTDGISWTKYDNPATQDLQYLNSDPVLIEGRFPEDWDFQVVRNPVVHAGPQGYEMWYIGTTLAWASILGSLNYAVSADGLNWSKSESNPVLSETPVWSQKGGYLGSSVLKTGNEYDLWYSYIELASAKSRIGYARDLASPVTEAKVLPLTYHLEQNYPNPFNPSTAIEFTLAKSEYVELKVFNILGKDIATLLSTNMNPGKHRFTFEAKNLASGVYYYQLVAGDYREVKKMILLR